MAGARSAMGPTANRTQDNQPTMNPLGRQVPSCARRRLCPFPPTGGRGYEAEVWRRSLRLRSNHPSLSAEPCASTDYSMVIPCLSFCSGASFTQTTAGPYSLRRDSEGHSWLAKVTGVSHNILPQSNRLGLFVTSLLQDHRRRRRGQRIAKRRVALVLAQINSENRLVAHAISLCRGTFGRGPRLILTDQPRDCMGSLLWTDPRRDSRLS